jgi:sugar phosphate isomerase/epimerase
VAGRARLSLSTVAFPAHSLPDALAWAARLPVAGVELGRDHAAELWRSPPAREAALDLCRRLRLPILSLHAWTQVEGLGDVCPLARDLGAGLIVVHCPHAALERDAAAQAELLRRWHAWCCEAGLTLTVENASRQPLEPFARLFRDVPGLAFTLDVKHAYKPETLGLTHADYLRALGDRVANLHVSGIDRARDELGDGIPPGRDAVDWSQLAGDLAQRHYAGLVTVEWAYPATSIPPRSRSPMPTSIPRRRGP